MIQGCLKEVSETLTYIINLYFKSGSVPLIWKYARLTPIHETGFTTKPKNGRPISVLPLFSKTLEREGERERERERERAKTRNYLLIISVDIGAIDLQN